MGRISTVVCGVATAARRLSLLSCRCSDIICGHVNTQVLLEGHLRPADLAREPFVSAVLQCFTAAGCARAREAAAALLLHLTPTAKHLAALEVQPWMCDPLSQYVAEAGVPDTSR